MNNVQVKDASGVSLQMRTLEADGVHTPYSLSDLSEDSTAEGLLYLLMAILEKLPRTNSNDQASVAIEAGTLPAVTTVSTVTTVTTVSTVSSLSNAVNIGGKHVSTFSDSISQMGALHLYNNIVVT